MTQPRHLALAALLAGLLVLAGAGISAPASADHVLPPRTVSPDPSRVAGGLGDLPRIAGQAYQETAGFAAVRDSGFDGTGVTVGVIGAVANIDAPEFLDIGWLIGDWYTTTGSCAPWTPQASAKGGNDFSPLIHPDWGWAPDVAVVHFVHALEPDEAAQCAAKDPIYSTLAAALQTTLNYGADIVVITEPVDAAPPGPEFAYAVARATVAGVPVVVAAGDDGALNDWARVNGVLAVGAADLAGEPEAFSPRGTGLTVTAPGTITGRDGSLNIVSVSSTSFAAMIVAALLAVGEEKWPQASGHQLVAALLATASGRGTWTEASGWGAVDPVAYLADDPSRYPDYNPLLGKMVDDPTTDGVLTARLFADYRDGLAWPDAFITPYGDRDYVYLGPGSTALPRSPSPSPAPTPSADWGVVGRRPWLTIPAAVLLALAAAWLVRRRGQHDQR
ncbi:MAG: S8 family serine peptidase [Propionibacteriaceae bacterium]|jgi:hypothetical protein|nr:S8 family serine peptidase [Propionibacteriaceae bacterium]